MMTSYGFLQLVQYNDNNTMILSQFYAAFLSIVS